MKDHLYCLHFLHYDNSISMFFTHHHLPMYKILLTFTRSYWLYKCHLHILSNGYLLMLDTPVSLQNYLRYFQTYKIASFPSS